MRVVAAVAEFDDAFQEGFSVSQAYDDGRIARISSVILHMRWPTRSFSANDAVPGLGPAACPALRWPSGVIGCVVSDGRLALEGPDRQ